MTVTELTTERLLLRDWRDADREQWAAMNADPEVRRYFPNLLTRAESDASVDRFRAHLTEHGWGLWAVEIRQTGEFIGFVGLCPLPDNIPAAPGVEVGWRLAREFWGRGYAPEAARAAVDHAFGVLGLKELVSQTTVDNTPSRRVMEKLGMTCDPADDFDHPEAGGTPCEAHVLYRLSAPEPPRAPTAAS